MQANHRLSIRRGAWAFAMMQAAILSLLSTPAGADEPPVSWDREIEPLLQRHCYRCHRDDDAAGNVNLRQDENPRLVLRNRNKWETVLDVLRSEQMPPDDARKLSDDDRSKIITYLDSHLGHIDCDSVHLPGTPPARRLTRHEYNLAIEDLTGLPIRPANDFPPEPTSFGFVGIGGASGLTSVEVSHYRAAAETVCDALVVAAETNHALAEHFFGSDPNPAPETAHQLLNEFADRAFRRPAAPDFLAGLNQIYAISIQQGADHRTSMRNAMSAVLMSPRFFMRIESPPQGEPSDEPYQVDAYDLASRLSFFLWAAPPDQLLRESAESGDLLRGDELQRQVHRMLRHRKVADGLVRGFFAQWLQYSSLISHPVDAKRFPEMTPALNRSMRREVERVLYEIIRSDRPVTDLVDADYTFVDTALAKHYGLPAIEKKGFHRVQLPDRRRGGVVVSAALLTLQSDPGRTNVPRRGNYIAGTFLGDPPPPPPPDVPELIASKDATHTMTLRQMLEKHRADPQCAACHAKMDPIGFTLENYDAIGRWRTEDAGQTIDASSDLEQYGMIAGPEGLKDMLIARKDDLKQTLAEQLLIYALGRGPREIDPCVIADAMDAMSKNNDQFSALVMTIVQSFPFTHRSDPAF
ncbi:hypothetical protein K227x_22090 [Rubripirellula lacrimiformis]|uniref:Planctomycete cytochrome C n=1 Tax=Rubripirellula lacrimiformis TaxID=1930273 RepID=A0A517N9L4_9BACT|nr:DUF1592 domain-containing protein [Rubripirellula lacrimiformis]QDT03824.1 hypothetical protein K227x_22090 [Rubripirellula lacrimiformis]